MVRDVGRFIGAFNSGHRGQGGVPVDVVIAVGDYDTRSITTEQSARKLIEKLKRNGVLAIELKAMVRRFERNPLNNVAARDDGIWRWYYRLLTGGSLQISQERGNKFVIANGIFGCAVQVGDMQDGRH